MGTQHTTQRNAADGATLDLALLCLVRDTPRHAYDIYRLYQTVAGLRHVWALKQSHLYAILARLEQAGYLAATAEQPGKRPPRRLLHLTEAGRAAYAAWLVQPVPYGRDIRQVFLARLYCALHDDPATARTLVARQRASLQRRLSRLQQRVAQLAEPHSYVHIVWQFRIGQLEASLAWLDWCEQHCLASAPPPPDWA